MFSASTAFLPSSFTMYTSTMGLAFALRRQYLGATVCFGIGAVLGWPFSVILFMPVVVLSMMESHFPFFSYVRGGIASSQVLLISTVFDYTKYRIWTLVPLNIILYNVLAAQQGRGPEVFGVEPVSYYFKNLLLNFNIMFPLALIAVPVVLVAGIDKLQRIKATACFLVWILVFSLQPHKEERFMYPVYPALVLNCAISLRAILETFGTTNVYISTKLGIQKDALQNTCKICFILTSALLSVLRISLMIDNYSAPLALFPSLPAGQRYCIAGDWYRFPTSFLLPHNSSLSFVESDFKGLLPGKFRDTWTLPSGMNDQNMWSADKVIKLSDCDALVSWKPELSSNHQFYFLDRETGTKHPGYYGYESLKQENSADRLNRLGIDLFGRKLDKEGKRFEEGELAGAIQRDSPKSVLK
ncbi:protein of unknown function [Taphrina deformans PYCC 5710]|uniref:Mannosyltransferase n=1 Tax=Taphrina deformans (strain PYCC 5710 / ATCC 11124 / CBS 356.35 / IMI 108563 / JCM 9778 / NBRC 8474) TaxID=1097556 RepID=R4XJH1_TAPDE|nr:protein of unknown function [Taphrina deformans PYCC 5710]|eukprot:CCG84608.1 protein of unknown function [Taphrina deformans PYCC 5710]